MILNLTETKATPTVDEEIEQIQLAITKIEKVKDKLPKSHPHRKFIQTNIDGLKQQLVRVRMKRKKNINDDKKLLKYTMFS